VTRAAAGAGALLVASLLAAAPAWAQNEPVRIFNRAAMPATALYVLRNGQSAWSGNLLRDPLAPGRFLAVRLGEGAGCRFDLRMILQDGREILRRDADVCATRSVDLAPTPPPAATPSAAGAAPPPAAEPAPAAAEASPRP
jgi:hypothetical protein